jgi:hypothetical protein
VESEGLKNIRIWHKPPRSIFVLRHLYSFFRDAEIMRQKQEKKKADAAAAAAGK